MENFVITFARGFGTGGKAIASQLAKELGIHCYENRILTLASQLSGLDENIFQEVNEKMRETSGFSSFLRGLPRSRRYISRNEKFVSDDKLFEYQSEIIKDLAEKESCVIVGKCADYVLKGKPNVVSIYIEAPRAFCVNRTMENMGVTEEVAAARKGRELRYVSDCLVNGFQAGPGIFIQVAHYRVGHCAAPNFHGVKVRILVERKAAVDLGLVHSCSERRLLAVTQRKISDF